MASRPKMTGRAFYESIGSPRVVLAPMVDQSEFAWRVLTRSFMPDDAAHSLLAYTPMLHSRLYGVDPKYRRKMFEPTRSKIRSSSLPTRKAAVAQNSSSQKATQEHDLFLDGNPSCDRPLTVQFCSNDAEDFLAAAQRVAPYCDAVDLNLGCPQGIARKGHYGAFLQEEWSLIRDMISTLARELPVPVTAKMRILETKEKTLEYARMIVNAGASILTVHGRRREQKGHITGVADWTVLRYLREQLPPETVLFANGNILLYEDIQHCLDLTGFDAVMSAEGNLCDPSIFAPPPLPGTKSREYWRGSDGKGGYRMDAVVRRYLDILYRHVLEVDPPQRPPLHIPNEGKLPSVSTSHASEPPKKKQKQESSTEAQQKVQSPNLLAVRPHLFSLLRPLVAKHTHIRDALAKAQPGDMAAYEHILYLIEVVTAEALVEHQRGNEHVAEHAEKRKSDVPKETAKTDVPDEENSSVATAKRCWRPWWVCQPHVRPLPAEAIAKGSITLGKKAKQQLQADESLAKDVGLPPQGSSTTVQPDANSTERIEVPKEGLVCG
ncbi:MAG: hypothetical protein Q9159_006253 [Coniocarpon cinnabarinum]